MKNRFMVLLAIVITFGLTSFAQAGVIGDMFGAGDDEYPSRTINMYVASSAGGGTDTWNRRVATLLEAQLGETIVVSNMPEGGGTAAQSAVWNGKHDGYLLLGVSETGCTWPAKGSTKLTSKDWQYFLYGGSPGVICVPTDSEYKTWEDLVKAAKANPGKINVANSGLGKLWHLKALVAFELGDIKVNHVPYKGSGPAIISVLSEEVDAITLSVAEAAEYVKSGEFRPLIMEELEDFDYPGYGKVEAVVKYFPGAANYYPLNQFLSFAVPKDLPAPVMEKLGEAFDKAMDTPEMAEFAANQMATVYKLRGEKANKMVEKMEAVLCYMMKDLGLSKVDLKAMGISNPNK